MESHAREQITAAPAIGIHRGESQGWPLLSGMHVSLSTSIRHRTLLDEVLVGPASVALHDHAILVLRVLPGEATGFALTMANPSTTARLALAAGESSWRKETSIASLVAVPPRSLLGKSPPPLSSEDIGLVSVLDSHVGLRVIQGRLVVRAGVGAVTIIIIPSRIAAAHRTAILDHL